jgi:hypothetical protein
MHDIKGNKLQINSIESREEVNIAVENPLEYNELIVPAGDNELVPKWYVDANQTGGVEDPATDPYVDSDALNTAYPDAGIRYEVICKDCTDGPRIYKKVSSTEWQIIMLQFI